MYMYILLKIQKILDCVNECVYPSISRGKIMISINDIF